MPIAVYLGLLLHSQTRQKNLIDKLYSLGLSISYERVPEIETATGNKICERFGLEKTVSLRLSEKLFTYGAIDNIDHIPSFSTSQSSFHGTGISLFQNREHENDGEGRLTEYVSVKDIKREKQLPLPTAYTQAMPAAMRRDHPDLPKDTEQLTPEDYFANTEIVEREYSWLQHSNSVLDNTKIEDVTAASNASWAAFFASQEPNTSICPSIRTMLPLFTEDSKSVAMIMYAMWLIKQSINFLNPGQIPVVALDQPRYAIAKKVQGTWPNVFGEDHFVVVLGGLCQ